MDHLGLEQAVLGGISLGANASLFAAARYPDRVRALVLEMPVLERAVPAAALIFAPMILLAHYGRPLMGFTSDLLAGTPRTPFGPLNSLLNRASLPPDTIAAVLHGVLVGPVAPTQEQRRAITAPTLVLAHRNDLIHPFDDAANLVAQLPRGVLVRARSPLELRLRPKRLTQEIVSFLGGLEPLGVPGSGGFSPSGHSTAYLRSGWSLLLRCLPLLLGGEVHTTVGRPSPGSNTLATQVAS